MLEWLAYNICLTIQSEGRILEEKSFFRTKRSPATFKINAHTTRMVFEINIKAAYKLPTLR